MSNSTGFSLHQTRRPLRESLVSRAFSALSDLFLRITAINELEQLSERQLRDIGVDRRQIEEVAAREIARLRER